jgi:heat-inducible transcriptional repressor
MTDMTPRRQAILGLVIRSYIDTPSPVGSKAFVTGYGLDLSPATIRNEMAALEELGFLTHPHTSAGRIPTERGYRFFVEHLLGETELPTTEKRMIRHQFHQARLQLEQWAQLAAAVLAHTTRKAALATAPRPPENEFKHLELISLRECMVLMVLVLQGGEVKQRMLSLEEPLDQEALSRLSNELNDLFQGKSGGDIATVAGGLEAAANGAAPGARPALMQQIAQIVAQIMTPEDTLGNAPIYREGLAHILEEPEFSGGGQMRQMVQVLEGPSLYDVILAAAQPLEVGGVQVLIGGEGRWEEFAELSLVLSRYGLKGSATGLLGVVGPIRMPYDRTIGAVRYVSQLMTALVSDWYNPSHEGTE